MTLWCRSHESVAGGSVYLRGCGVWISFLVSCPRSFGSIKHENLDYLLSLFVRHARARSAHHVSTAAVFCFSFDRWVCRNTIVTLRQL